MKQLVRLDFANPRINIVEHYDDVLAAVKHASHNLYCRHRVEVLDLYTDNDCLMLLLEIPNSVTEFRLGAHLTGISKYLLDKHETVYRPYMVGSRLLFFTHKQLGLSDGC